MNYTYISTFYSIISTCFYLRQKAICHYLFFIVIITLYTYLQASNCNTHYLRYELTELLNYATNIIKKAQQRDFLF